MPPNRHELLVSKSDSQQGTPESVLLRQSHRCPFFSIDRGRDSCPRSDPDIKFVAVCESPKAVIFELSDRPIESVNRCENPIRVGRDEAIIQESEFPQRLAGRD